MKIRVQLYCTVLYFSLYLGTCFECRAQKNGSGNVSCDFTLPDTVCRNAPFSITNLSQGASTYFWKYCAGTPLSFPSGISSGSLAGRLFNPHGITLVRDGNIFYAFITNSDTRTILRLRFDNGLLNPPSYNTLQNTGILSSDIFGIQVKNENGNWYGFVTNGNSLARLDFGTSLANLSPTVVTNVTSPVMNVAQGLVIDYDGQNWVGFCTNYPAATITRFDWGNSLSSTPGVMNLGNIGGLTMPMQPALINDGSGWYMFVANTTSLSQLNFGNSLLNIPTGTNLGNMTWITDNRGVSMFIECSNPYALLTNHDVVTNQIMQIHFKGGLNGTKSVTPLGNVGDLYEIVALSETVNVGDTLFSIAVNSTPSTTVLYFPPCLNSVIPTSTQFDPSPVVFPDEGTFTVSLKVDSGLPTEQQVCKEITVISAQVNLGNDTSACEGNPISLNAGQGFQSYTWSTGETSQSLTVLATGIYSVTVTNSWGCHMTDSVHVTFNPNAAITVDTTICYGEHYFAGGKYQSSPGTYTDTLSAANGCYLIRTTHLSVYPAFSIYIGRDTCITDSTQLHLIAHVPGATGWIWQDGTHDSTFTVSAPGVYWVNVFVNTCVKSDTINVTACPGLTYFYLPNAFTPNGDGLNDVFRPIGNDIVDFQMMIYNRWGQLVFETKDWNKGWDGSYKGRACEPGTYAYKLTYKNLKLQDKPAITEGFVTLIQ
jgi:gliding motility-associated-like protein